MDRANFFTHCKKLVLLGIMSGAVLCRAGSMDFRWENPKIIDLSKANPTVEYLQKNLERMEMEAPLDGISIRVWGKSRMINGRKYIPGAGNVWGKISWTYEDFSEAVQKLKHLKFKKFKHNFFYAAAYPPDGDWLNDDGWKIIVNNFRIAAKIAKECGLKGIMWDIEEYEGYVWKYDKLKTSLNYDQAWKRAFTCGQQWGSAVFSEFPDAVIFMPIMLTLPQYGSRISSLNIPFMNGVLEAMPITATLIEGNEGASYRMTSCQDYNIMQERYRNDFPQRILYGNQSKFRRLTRLAPGMYMDPLLLPTKPGNEFAKTDLADWKQLGRMNFIRRYFAAMFASGSEYVWLYSEKCAWWSKSNRRGVHLSWEEQCPGISKLINELKNPALMKCDPKLNLVENGDFARKGANWAEWQVEMDRKKPAPGKVIFEEGKAIIRDFSFGSLVPRKMVPTEKGKYYYLRIRGSYGNPAYGQARVSVNFFDKARKLLLPNIYSIALALPKTGKEEYAWKFFMVPDNAAYIQILPGVVGQTGGGEVIFREIFMQEF